MTTPAPRSDDDGETGGALAGLAWALRRDLKLAFRTRSELAVQLLFYAIVVTLFPLATTPERTLLSTMGPGVLWVAALLASLLSLPRIFALDQADGTLEQMALSPWPLPAIVSGKILAHWLTTGLPVVLLSPLAALQYGLDKEHRLTATAVTTPEGETFLPIPFASREVHVVAGLADDAAIERLSGVPDVALAR